MSWTVMKFGGSSLANSERVARAAALVAAHPGRVAVVVSAQGDTTDRLEAALRCAARGDRAVAIEIVDGLAGGPPGCALLLDELRKLLLGISLLGEASAPTRDLVLSHGERLSMLVMTEALRAQGRDAIAVDARTWLRTDERFGDARVRASATESALAVERTRWGGADPRRHRVHRRERGRAHHDAGPRRQRLLRHPAGTSARRLRGADLDRCAGGDDR